MAKRTLTFRHEGHVLEDEIVYALGVPSSFADHMEDLTPQHVIYSKVTGWESRDRVLYPIIGRDMALPVNTALLLPQGYVRHGFINSRGELQPAMLVNVDAWVFAIRQHGRRS